MLGVAIRSKGTKEREKVKNLSGVASRKKGGGRGVIMLMKRREGIGDGETSSMCNVCLIAFFFFFFCFLFFCFLFDDDAC